MELKSHLYYYDATHLESDGNRKSIVEVISFNLRPSLSFRTMGAFYHWKSSSSPVLSYLNRDLPCYKEQDFTVLRYAVPR